MLKAKACLLRTPKAVLNRSLYITARSFCQATLSLQAALMLPCSDTHSDIQLILVAAAVS